MTKGQALTAAAASCLVAASVFLPGYAGVFTAIASFLPSLAPVVTAMFKRS